MRKTAIIFIIFLLALLSCNNKSGKEIREIRFISWNIEFFAEANAEKMASLLHEYDPDIIGLQEVPEKEGFQSTHDVQEALNRIEMDRQTGFIWYSYTGKIGSGNDDRKFKSLLSRTPLKDTMEIDLMPPGGRRGASAVKGVTEIFGKSVSVYSLHTPAAPHYKLTLMNDSLLKNDNAEIIVIMGDFNERLYGPGDSAIRANGFVPFWEVLGIDVSMNRTYDATGKYPDEGVIDHIYIKGKDIRITDGGIIEPERALSDHCPVWAAILIE